uniref:DUF4794 domain-containing protein n=1 Tax=Anopheles coluzzii TaxID=1518534 RepID=A0A8W7PA93_ANOCL
MAFHLFLRILSFIFWCGLITVRPAGALPAGPGIEILPAQFSKNGQLDYVVVNENEETNFLEQQPVPVREPQRQAEYVVPQLQERPLQIQQRVQSVPQVQYQQPVTQPPQQQQQPSYAQYQQPSYYYSGAPQSSGQYYSTPPERGSDEGSIHPVQS